jgi:hypothetical protein
MHQRVDARGPRSLFSYAFDQGLRQSLRSVFAGRVVFVLRQQPIHSFTFIAPISGGDRFA